jgi:hypothetical protein
MLLDAEPFPIAIEPGRTASSSPTCSAIFSSPGGCALAAQAKPRTRPRPAGVAGTDSHGPTNHPNIGLRGNG